MDDWKNKLEPEAKDIAGCYPETLELICQISVAISLKRIADELKALNGE